MKIKITGVNKLLRKLKGYPKKVVNQFIRSTMRKSCDIVIKTAKINVPVDTGLLKKSIGRKVLKKRSAAMGIVGARLEFGKKSRETKKKPFKYLHLVETGTKHSKAQPFLIPALTSNMQRILSLWKSELRKVLK